MKISIASDHGGFLLKEQVKNHLKEKGYEIIDFGTHSLDSCDYSALGIACAEAVRDGLAEKGIVICTSGEGIMISANKVKGVRCGLLYNEDVAKLTRQHNDCNMMALGAKFISPSDALRYVDIFLSTEFEGGRHIRRVDIIKNYEK